MAATDLLEPLGLDRGADGLLVVDDEPEVAAVVARLRAALADSARNWSPMSMNAIPALRPRSSKPNSRP